MHANVKRGYRDERVRFRYERAIVVSVGREIDGGVFAGYIGGFGGGGGETRERREKQREAERVAYRERRKGKRDREI